MNAKQRELKKQAQDWTARALGTFVACQHYKIEPPQFRGYTPLVLCILSGRDDDVIEMCKEFVEAGQPLLVKAEQAAREASYPSNQQRACE